VSKFWNPYHFVPTNSKPNQATSVEDFKKATTQTSQAHYLHHRYAQKDDQDKAVFSGRVLCRLTTETPLVVGAQRTEASDDKAAKVTPFLYKDKPAIPASSLRGMISSMIEAASNSALRVLENRLLSYRMDAKGAPSAMGMVVLKDDMRYVLPLTLPTLQAKSSNKGTFEIPKALANLRGCPSALRAYLHAYEAGDTKIQHAPNGLRTVHPELQSFRADAPEYWYLKLNAAAWYQRGNDVIVTRKDDLKILGNQFLLGYRAEPKQLISEGQYHQLSRAEQAHYQRGVVRILGIDGREDQIPSNKKYEYFLPVPYQGSLGDYLATLSKDDLLEATEAIALFEELADQRFKADETLPYELEGTSRDAAEQDGHFRLNHGDIICFDVNENGVVTRLATSSIWRGLVTGKRTHAYFAPELRPFSAERSALSIAELMLGFVEQAGHEDNAQPESARAFASRLKVSFAHLEFDDDNGQIDNLTQGILGGSIADLTKDSTSQHSCLMSPRVLKILDSPKPPSPALYFRQTKDQPVDKANMNPKSVSAQGRKFYLHHESKHETADASVRLKQKSEVTPVKPDTSFLFHVDFTNLNIPELSLLFYALQPSDTFRHKLGMGKPLGLGTVRLEPFAIFFVNHQNRYTQSVLVKDRYSAFCTTKRANLQALPDRYKFEAACVTSDKVARFAFNDIFTSFRDEHAKTMNPHIKRALELLGDSTPEPRWPVHTPLTQRQYSRGVTEDETFEWFVENNRALASSRRSQAQRLEPITKDTEHLPTLSRDD
jgi:CRISPR-associated protein (TIGR03986 family)